MERFVALNNKESSSPAPTHEDYDDQIKADTADGGAPISATATTATTAAATATATTPSSSSTNMRIRKLPTVDARIVHIDPTTCVCPNCDNPIQLMHLTQSEIKSTRNAISDYLMSTMNNEQYANPEWFRQWILKKGPFRYIIDGANVAFSGGRVNVQFTFNQIKVLLEKLSEPRYLPGKPLVILPHNFLKSFLDPRYKGAPRSQLSSTIIPNKDGEMSRKDINTFVWQMHRKGMLFSIPKGFSDDLFWVYATLENTLHSHIYSITTTIGSSSSSSSSPLTTDMKADTLSSSNSKQSIPSTQNSDTSGSDTSNSKLLDDRIYIISNDCTNDHRGLFPSAQAFVRWRASQVIMNIYMRMYIHLSVYQLVCILIDR